jgi:hypothetical protein
MIDYGIYYKELLLISNVYNNERYDEDENIEEIVLIWL